MRRSNIDLSFKQKDLLYRLALSEHKVRACHLQAQPATILSLMRRGLVDSPDFVKGVFPTTSEWFITEKGMDIVNCLRSLERIMQRRRRVHVTK